MICSSKKSLGLRCHVESEFGAGGLYTNSRAKGSLEELRLRADGGMDQCSRPEGMEKYMDRGGHCRLHQAVWTLPCQEWGATEGLEEAPSVSDLEESSIVLSGCSRRAQSEGRLDTGHQGKSLSVQGSANYDPWPNLACRLF